MANPRTASRTSIYWSIYWLFVLGCLLLASHHSIAERTSAPTKEGSLRVCADPNNLPFSNERGEGFENKLAELLARELGRELTYTWWAQRRGFVRNTLAAGTCDLILGTPAESEMALTTRPYYRSTYVFVTRAAERLDIESLDDPRLRQLKIGVHTIGDDFSNVPPAHALSQRGIIDNVRGFSIYGDYSRPDPPRALIDAVARGEIDVAIAWGPLAGYFASRSQTPLAVTAVSPARDGDFPMVFDIAMAVRRSDRQLKEDVETVLLERRNKIDGVLRQFGIPLLPLRTTDPAQTHRVR